MDFHGMNRKNLQILCKKHGIPANLKNIEMANRLASLFQEEEGEETVTETKISPEEDSVEGEDGIKEEEENRVASRKAKKVRFSPETDNQVFEFTPSVKKKSVRTRRRRQDGTGKGIQEDTSIELRRSKRSVAKGITVDGSNSISGIVEAEKGPSDSVKVTRRSDRIGSRGSAQEEGKDTDLIAPEQFRDTYIKGGRRSTRLAGITEKSSEEGGTSKLVTLLPAAKTKRIGSCGSTQEEGKATDLIASQQLEDKDIHGGRRSTRLAAKTEKSCVEGGTSKSVTLLPPAKRSKGLVDVANKEDDKETGEQQHRKDEDSKVEMVRRRSSRFVNDIVVQTNTQDQTRSVRLKANPPMGQANNDSVKASRVVDQKTDKNLVKSSKRVTRNMKRDRSAEPVVDSGTASNQSNLAPKKTMDEFTHFEQEEACGADVKAGGSSKKSKTMTQDCIKDKPQGTIVIEDSPSSSQAKAVESGMNIEKVFDLTLDKSVGSPQRSNIGELNCEPMKGECEEKLEQDAVSKPVMEEVKDEVSSRYISSPKDKLHVPTGHILVKDIASPVIAEESTKTKDETLIYAPEHSSIAKLANVEEILENSTECWNEIHSSEDDEKDCFEKDVQVEDLHGNFSECNTENSSAEIEISKIGHCVNLTPEKLLGEYAQLEPEEAERHNVEARSSSQKMKKTTGQEFVKDKPQGMAEDSPSTSETKTTESVMISESVLDSTQKVSGGTSAVRNSHELDSEVLEEGREGKHEQATTKKDKGEEASSLSEFLIERLEVKTCPDNRSIGCSLSVETTLPSASVQLAMSNTEADLGVPTGNEIVSTVITQKDKITKEETSIFTPTSELKEHSSVAKLVQVEAILETSAECFKEDENGSLEKDVQVGNLHVNFSECNIENKDSCMSVNLTPGRLLDTYTELVPEEAGGPNVDIRSSSKKTKTVSSEFLKENPQGMVEDTPSTFVAKTAETIMMSENVSVDILPVGNTQELNPELRDEEHEEKQELDIVLVAETENEKKKASSPSEFLIERPEVSIHESELFVETTPPPPSVHIAVSNPESELSVPTGHILVKDIVSAVIAEEDIITEDVPESVHSFVAKLAETDVLENSVECWNESLSRKDDDRGYLEKEKQSAKRHGNFSEYEAENNSAEEEAGICKVGRLSDGHCVNRETLDEVKDESLMKSVQTISSEGGCKPSALEEMKALSQSTPINKAASNALDLSSVFTTPERNLMLMEQPSESGKILAADIVTQHNVEAVETVVFTTAEKFLLLGDSGLADVGKEEEHTATDFPDDLNATQNEAFNEKDRMVVELHDEFNIAASPLRQSSIGDFKEERTERNEENRTVKLHCESGTFTGPDKHAALLNSVSDGAETIGGNKAMEFCEESVGFTGLEERHELFGYSGQDIASEGEVTKAAQLSEEAGLSSEIPLADPELGEPGLLGSNNADKSGSLEGQLLNGDAEQKKAVKPTEKEAAEFHDESAVLNIPERHPFLEESELEEATKSEENNALDLQADCDKFTGANVTATSHGMSDVLTTSENHSLMGDFEPGGEENKDVELLGESNISTNEESGQNETIKHNTAATCEESFVFISPERRHHLGNSEQHTAGKQERKEVEFEDESALFTRLETRLLLGESGQDRLGNGESGSTQFQSHHASSPKVILKDNRLVRESHVAAPDFRENTVIESKVYHSHEFSAGKETGGAGFMPKASQAENVVGLDAMQGTSKQSRENSPHVDSANHFDFDTMGTDTIMGAERNVSFSSNVLALPAKGNSQTTGEISNPLEVARTCSLVSDAEESGPSTEIQNQLHDATDELVDANVTKNTQNDPVTIGLPAEGDSETIGKNFSQLEVTETCSTVSEKSSPSMDIQNHINDALQEKLTVTGNSKADELIEAKVTKNVDSSGGSDVSSKTCGLAGTEDEHSSYNFEVTDPVDTAFEKDISLAPDQSTLQENRNEEAADDDMVKGEATRSPEETLAKPSDNIGESGMSSEKQVRREPVLIYRTQAKPKRHDMKENAPNSKIVDNLNVTAPRTSKRQPLQDLRKN